MDVEMKDFTSTSFGLIIAYLLPGLAGTYTIFLYLKRGTTLAGFSDAKTPEAEAGLLLLLILVALIVGVLVNAVHRLGLQRGLDRGRNEMKFEYFANLTPNELACFIAVVDEFYRMQQFYGGIAVVMPFLYFRLAIGAGWSETTWLWTGTIFVLALLVALFGAWKNWNNYVNVGKKILGVSEVIAFVARLSTDVNQQALENAWKQETQGMRRSALKLTYVAQIVTAVPRNVTLREAVGIHRLWDQQSFRETLERAVHSVNNHNNNVAGCIEILS